MSRQSRIRRAAWLARKGQSINYKQSHHIHSRAADKKPKKAKVSYFQDSRKLRLMVKRLKAQVAELTGKR